MSKEIAYINKCLSTAKTPKPKYKTKMDLGRTKSDPESIWLLWGDRVQILEKKGTKLLVKARGQEGLVTANHVGGRAGKPLLEVYVMDVGQGDGVLYRTPDLKWHLVDAGTHNSRQMTKKGAPNFIRWKFQNDLGERGVTLENVFMSHPDLDHFGGLINLMEGKVEGHKPFPISIETFYHSGMGRFKSGEKLGKVKAGTVPPFPFPDHGLKRGDTFIYELLSDQESFKNPNRPFADYPFVYSFARLAELVGTVPNDVSAISYLDDYVPDYGPGENEVTMRVLGPIIEEADKVTGLRELSSDSKTRNGHSVILRLDYKDARIMLTGDTNDESQRLTLSYIDGSEFLSDVAKGCHHGAEDIYMKFVGEMAAKATVISSGDNESYAHPRPVVIGASGFYGRKIDEVTRKEVLPPLVYSTELARSVKLEYPSSVRIDSGRGANRKQKRYDAEVADIKTPDTKYTHLEETPISTDLIYGLVNVRTDGKQIMCATMTETGGNFDLKVFKAGN